jgi:hypothetical protein
MSVPVRSFLHAALIATFWLASLGCSGSDDPVPASALSQLGAGFGSVGGGAAASSQQIVDGWTLGLEASQAGNGGGMVTFE